MGKGKSRLKDKSHLFASKDLTIGEVNALVKILGGEEVVRGILDGSSEVTITAKPSIFGYQSKIMFYSSDNCFNPHEFFKTRKGLRVEDWFRIRILSGAEKVTRIPSKKGMFSDLINPANDTEIRAKLSKGHVFENPAILCYYLAYLLDQQPNGEEGHLLTNGCANIFHVGSITGEVFAVYVYWRSGYREWYVTAFRLDDDLWNAGLRVFSATAVA